MSSMYAQTDISVRMQQQFLYFFLLSMQNRIKHFFKVKRIDHMPHITKKKLSKDNGDNGIRKTRQFSHIKLKRKMQREKILIFL